MIYSPQHRLKVFISSAQNEENGFDWEKVRRKIKDKLSKCPYLSPYIIEDDTSEISSTQLFISQVEQSDLIVLLVKGELRKGTEKEFIASKQYKKPILIYFFKDENPSVDVTKLKKEIENTDYCTYCGCLDSFDRIEEKVLHDIIENTISYYKFKHVDVDLTQNETAVLDLPEVSPFANFVPVKSALGFFKSCYETIYELMGLGQMSRQQEVETCEFHDLGNQLLRWLILGERIRDTERLASFIEKGKEIFPGTGWLVKRWDAIKWFLNDDIAAALRTEEEALDVAKKENTPEWIQHEILIDCRNLENIKNHGNIYGKHQEELDVMTSFVYFPVADRLLEQTYNKIIQEEIRINTLPRNTLSLGNNFREAVNDFENYFFIAVMYGSYTHLIISRRILAQITYKYGNLFSDDALRFISISLYLLNGEVKEFKNILSEQWDSVYSRIVVNSDRLYQLTDRVGCGARDSAKQVFLSKLGLYLSDESFYSAEKYLIEFAPVITWENAETYFDCIIPLMQRLDHYKIFKAVLPIIIEGRFNLGRSICHFLFGLELEKIPDPDLIELCDALNKKLQIIMERNGEPQLIAYLMKQRPDIFQPLYNNPKNGLVGIQKSYYELNVGEKDWCDLLDSLISNAQVQYNTNKSKNSFAGFMTNPFSEIAGIVENHFSSEIARKVTENYFPICIAILSNEVSLPFKSQCIYSLCRIVARYSESGYGMPSELKTAIEQCEIQDDSLLILFTSETADTVKQSLKFLKVLAGGESLNTLFKLFYGYPHKEKCDRLSLAEGVFALLKQNAEIARDMMILSLVLQFCEDGDYVIRIKGMKCLSVAYAATDNRMAKEQMMAFTLDPSAEVRNMLLDVCTATSFPNEELTDGILATLMKDANFAINKRAKELNEKRRA